MTLTTDTLQSLVAHFLGIAPEAVTPSTLLNGTLASSLGRARLDAALRQRLGIRMRACYTARTFGELQASANGDQSTAAAVSSVVAPRLAHPQAISPTASVGFDLQSAEELPECTDYWSHPFYAEHFTATEIAAGLLHPEPRMHFAGVWCAKEALKKCSPELLRADWREMEVRLGTDERPMVYVKEGNEWCQLAASISITHTGKIAGAVAVFNRS
jgi:phosphopantetheine--protein transferase-like protein